MIKIKKTHYIGLTIFLLFLFGLIFYQYKQQQQQTNLSTKILTQTNKLSIPARPDTFAKGQKTFDQAIKLAQIASLKNDYNKAQYYVEQAFIIWRDVINEFINTPPANIQNQQEWTNKLSAIYQNIQTSKQLWQDNKFILANEKLDKSQKLLNTLAKETAENKINNRLSSLLFLVKKIDSTDNYQKAKSNINDLKLAYTEVKDTIHVASTLTVYQNFEKILSNLDNATPATFARAQAKLKPAFLAIYEN